MRNSSGEKKAQMLTTYLDTRLFRLQNERKFAIKRNKGSSNQKDRACYSNLLTRDAAERELYATAMDFRNQAARDYAHSPSSAMDTPRMNELAPSKSEKQA